MTKICKVSGKVKASYFIWTNLYYWIALFSKEYFLKWFTDFELFICKPSQALPKLYENLPEKETAFL